MAPGFPKTRSRTVRWVAQCILLFALTDSVLSDCEAQNASQDEYEVRAAMLFNLTKFIDWPDSKLDQEHPEFVVCLLGSDPIRADLTKVLQNKTIKAKPVVLRQLRSLEAVKDCHILYIGGGEIRLLSRALSDIEKNSVLTISERSNKESPGQAIGLPTMEEHVHIDINLNVAQRSKLVVSSKLLHLATVSS